MFCQEQQTLIPSKPEDELSCSLGAMVPAHLLPLVVKFLTDTNSQVVRTSHLLERITDIFIAGEENFPSSPTGVAGAGSGGNRGRGGPGLPCSHPADGGRLCG